MSHEYLEEVTIAIPPFGIEQHRYLGLARSYVFFVYCADMDLRQEK